MTFTSVYEDDFLRAFPMVVDEIESSSYSSPEEYLHRFFKLKLDQSMWLMAKEWNIQ